MPETKQFSKEEFIRIKPEDVKRGFPQWLDRTNLGYLDRLREHPDFFIVYASEYLNIPDHLVVQIQFIHTKPEDFFETERKFKRERQEVSELRYSPSSDLWNAIWYAAGGEFISQHCGVTERKFSDRGLLTYVKYESVGAVRLMDGTIKTERGDKAIDFEALKDMGKSESFIQKKRQYAVEIAQSGANARCIRKALGMPSSFSKDEVGRVWVVPKVQPRIDMNNPMHAAMVMQNSMMSINLLYHQSTHAALPAAAERLSLPETAPLDRPSPELMNGDHDEELEPIESNGAHDDLPPTPPARPTQPEPTTRRPAGDRGKPISEAQEKRLFAIAKSKDVSPETLKSWLRTFWGYEHVNLIGWKDYNAICDDVTAGKANASSTPNPPEQPAGKRVGDYEVRACVEAVNCLACNTVIGEGEKYWFNTKTKTSVCSNCRRLPE